DRRSVASRDSTAESGSVAEVSCQILSFDLEEAPDDGRGLLPFPGLRLQLLATGGGEPIKARAAVVFRCAPLEGNQAFLLELEQQGIERALVDSQKVSADLLNPSGNSPAMLRSQDI